MAQGRRARRVIRKVDTFTVLRFSLIFYASMLVVGLVAGVLLWVIADATGVIHNIEKFIKAVFALDSFHLVGSRIFEAGLIGGLVLVLIGTGANVLVALIYNLTSDVAGGIEVIVLEEEPVRRSVV